MCGIFSYIGSREAVPILLRGLESLEYRGYDSAGVAVITPSGEVFVSKKKGKLAELMSSLEGVIPQGRVGVGHTRWATHGRPSTRNAHPHLDCRGEVAVVHNGIVENYLALKKELIDQGHSFTSETDTEVIPHLIESLLAQGHPLPEAVRLALLRLEGAHALVVLSLKEQDKVVGARLGNAGGVVVGYGEGEMFLASDLAPILPHTPRMAFLGSKELAVITSQSASFMSLDGSLIRKEPQAVPYDSVSLAKGGYKHFMLKEIMEQPEVVMNTLSGNRLQFEPASLHLEDFPFTPAQVRRWRRAYLLGCGTSLHAALVGKYLLEHIARLPADGDYSSEFRYRSPVLDETTLVVAVGQSGETADSLAAMEYARERGAPLITVCNVPGSQATRLAQGVIYMRAGPEVAVASTKTFLASLVCLYLLAGYVGRMRGVVGEDMMQSLVNEAARLPSLIGQLLEKRELYEALAHRFFRLSNFLYLGRGIHYPIALEGALKLKEISYIHAEGYPAGEMKHGPIALIDENMPVITLALQDHLYGKMVGNIEEVKARGGIVLALGNEGDDTLAGKADYVISIPRTSPFLAPALAVVPLQLFAYYIGVRRGCDVDQPRNLAKSVTVE